MIEVIGWVGSEEFTDSDLIPMSSWSDDDKIPCYYVGAWVDGLDFIGSNHEFVKEQQNQPQRHFFVFNKIPESIDQIEKAIIRWAG